MHEYFKKLHEYNTWANLQIADALANQITNEKSTIGLLAHILTAEKVWLGRVLKTDESVTDLWPSLSIGKCREIAVNNSVTLEILLNELNEKKMGESIEYSTTKKKVYSMKLIDILTHLINHGAYHRAQINSEIKQNGGDAVSIDYIAFIQGKK